MEGGRRFVLCKGKQSREKDRQEKEIQSDNRFLSVIIVSEKKETGWMKGKIPTKKNIQTLNEKITNLSPSYSPLLTYP